MKTKIKSILTLLLAFMLQISFAQERDISGNVTDDMGSVSDISVKVKGTTKGTVTDFDGNYTIKAKTGDTLEFSHVSYGTIQKVVGTSNKIDVTMNTDGNTLDEVIVTALGIKRDKKSLGVSQQSIGGEELVKAKETDISNALAGKVAGLQIVGNSSSTFNNSQIKLRGESNVLYVIDGIKVNSSSDINPENVANISVLKGGSATALYGPEGRNGVVIITSKTAKKGKAIFEINHSTTINTVTNLPEYQNEYGGGYSQTFNTFSYNAATDPASWAAFDGQMIPNYQADESWGPRMEGQMVRHWDSWIPGSTEFGKLRAWSPSTSDVSDFYNNALTSNTSLSFSKADDKYAIRTSLNYIDRGGIVPNSERKSTQVNINASYDISDKFELNTIINYENRKTLNNPEQNYGNLGSNFNQWWQRQLNINRLENYEHNGNVYSWNINSPRDPSPLYWDMPYFHSYENTKHQTKNTTYGKLGGKYTFTDNFSAKIEFKKSFNAYDFDDRGTTKSLLDQSFYRERAREYKKDEVFFMTTYKNKFNNNDIDLLINIGGETSKYRFSEINAQTSGGLTIPGFYNLAGSKNPALVTSDYENWDSKGVFGTTSIGYKNLLYLDGSYRLDWKSTANPNKNKVGTYGASASFLVHKLMERNDILSFAKIRAGISTAPIFPNTYLISSTYTASDPTYQGEVTQSVSSTQPNPNLTGGLRKENEIGIELGLLKNRISLDLTYFNRNDIDNPVRVALDGSTGYTSAYVNAGETTSKGLEFALFGDVIKTNDFTFGLGFNFATLSKVVNYISDGVKSRDLSTYTSRMKLQERVGEEWGLFYGSDFARGENGEIMFSENNGNYSYTEHKNQLLGSLLPDYTGGISSNFRYKNVDLSLGFDFQKGGKYYSRTERYFVHSGLALETAGLNDRGNPQRDPVANGGGVHITGVLRTGSDAEGNPISDGTVVDTYVEAKDIYGLGNIGQIYSNNLHDASYFKLRSIRLNYTLNPSFANKAKMQAASIGFFANNVWLISSDLPWVDPSELEKRSGINWAENGTLPATRSIGLNLKLTF